MNEILMHYINGDPEHFQDFLEHPDCTNNDKLDALIEIGQKGWDECLEILVNRDDSVLLTQQAAQAWADMASKGYTAAWMLMIPSFYEGIEKTPAVWSEALQVGRNDATIDKHWDLYALTTTLEHFVAAKKPAAQAQMALIGMRIELMHGMDAATANKEIAESFAHRQLGKENTTKNVNNVFDEMNFF